MSRDAALPRREVERVVTDCPKCAGKGWIFEGAWKECAACYGTGLPPRTVEIHIRAQEKGTAPMSDLKRRLIDMANDFKSRAMFNNEANALKALERIEALEAEVAELKSNSITIAGNRPDLHPTATASLLEKKPAPPSVEHITGVALKEPPDRPGRHLYWFLPKPKRPHDVMAMMRSENADPNGCEQGFVTSDERFVTRLEAMQIAKAAGQLIRPERGGYQGPELFSEDLW